MYTVRLEGLAGITIYIVVLPLICLIPCSYDPDTCPFGHVEDLPQVFYQMSHNMGILFAVIGVICSLACFNYFGQSVTKYAGATARSTIATFRTVVIWIFSLALKWEEFKYLQVNFKPYA